MKLKMAASLPVLTFHALDERQSVISFSPELFRRAVEKLYENGYRTISLAEALESLNRGGPFPDRSFVITFDDGYRSVFDEAFPVLEKYGMSATVFLTVGDDTKPGADKRLPSLNGLHMLAWKEIKEMQKGGIDFGAHTLTHPDLTTLPFDSVEYEIRKSKEIIEDALGTAVPLFAYPYGKYDDRSLEVAGSCFLGACSDRLGLLTCKSGLYTIERVDAYYLRSERLFDLMLTRFFPLYIQACSIPRRIRRAVKVG